MVRQTEGKIEYPPFVQQIFDQGEQKGKLDGLREVLLRLLSRAEIAISEDDRARIDACTDAATLDRWIENVLGAKSSSP